MKKIYFFVLSCICASGVSATTYTNVAGTALNVASNWTTNGLAAGGTAASDFVTSGDVFILANAPAATSLTANWTLGAVTLNITRAVTFNGGRAMALNGTTASSNNVLTFSVAGNTLTVGDGVTPTSLTCTGTGRLAFSVATATMAINALATVDMQGTGSTITYAGTILTNNGLLKTASTSATALPASKDYTNGGTATGQISFYAAAAQTIPAGTYYDVLTSGGFTKTIGVATVKHELNAGASTTVRPSAIGTVITGTGATLTGSGIVAVTATSATALTSQYNFTTYTLTGMTVDFNSATAQSIASSATVGNYGALKITTTTAGLKTLLGNITVLGDLTVVATTAHNALDVSASNYQITLAGNWINTSTSGATALFVGRSGTVVMNGTGAQSISASGGVSYPNFNTLRNSNTAATLTLNNTVTLAGDMINDANATLSPGANTINVGGNWTNNGTFTAGTSTVIFNSTPSHVVSGVITGANKFNHLTFSSVTPSAISFGGDVEIAGNLTVSGTGTFTAPSTMTVGGNFTQSAGTFTAPATMNLAGNFARSAGTFTANGGNVVLNGTTAQSLPGTAATTFSTLTIDNTASRTLTSTGAVTIGNAFTLPATITWNAATFAVAASGGLINNGTYTASTTQALTVTGNFTNGATGNFTSGTGATAVTVSGNFSNAGTYNSGAAGTLTVAGDFANTGTFSGSTGTVVLNGTGSRTISGTLTGTNSFNNLTFNNAAGTWNFSADAEVKNVFTITTGTVNAPTGTLYVGGTFAHTAGTFNANGGTVSLNGAGAQTLPGTLATTFSTLSMGGGTRTVTLNRGVTVATALTIPADVTLATATNALTCNSDLINNGTYTSTTTQVLQVLGNFTNGATGVFTSGTSATAVAVTGNFSNAGTYNSGAAGTLTVTGDYANTGTFNGSTGTVVLNGTGSRTISGTLTGTGAFNNLTFNNAAGTWNFSADAEVKTTFTMTTGTVNAPAGTLYIGGTFAHTAGTFNHNSGTVSLNGAGAQTLPGTLATSFSTLSMSGGTRTVTLNRGVTVATAFTIPSGVTLATATNALTLSNNFTNDGTYTATTTQALTVSGNFTNSASGVFTSGTGATAVAVTGNFSNAGTYNSGAGGTLTVTGDYANSGTFNPSTGTVALNGTGTRTISGTLTGTGAFNNLTFNNAAGTWNFGADAEVKGAFTITTGTVNAPSGTLYVGGNFAHTAGTFNANSGTVNLNGAGAQALPGTLATVFNTLTMNGGTRTITMNRGTTVTTALTIPSGVTFATAANALTVNSDLINNGTYTSSTQALTVTGNLTNTGTFTSSSSATALTLTGNFNNSGTYISTTTGTIILGGSYANTGTFTANTGTVRFSATAGGRTLSGNMTGTSKFRNLTFVGVGGAWSFGNNDAEVGAIFTLTSGTVTAPSGTLKVAGNFAKAAAGVFTHNNGTVELNGTAAQAIPTAAITYYNLNITNTTATVTANAAFTVNNQLSSSVGSTLNMTTRALSGTFNASTFNGTLLTQTTAAALPTGVTFGGTVIYNATAAQAVARGTYNNLTLTGTTAAKTLGAGAMTVNGNFTQTTTTGITVLAGALDVNGNISITGTTANNVLDASASNYQVNCAGNWSLTSTTATTLFNPRAGTVIFDGAGTQTIATNSGSVIPSFFNATITNTANAVTVNTNTNITGTLSIGANAVLRPSATVVFNNAVAAGTVSGTGTLQVTRTTATADYNNQYKFTTNTLGALTVDYAAAGAQNVNAYTYGTLKTTGSGTKTAMGNVTVNNGLNVGSGTALDLGATYRLIAGTAPTYTVDGSLKTSMLTATGTNAIPSGASWGGSGTVNYSVATGYQTVVSGTYTNLDLSNTSNTDTIIGTVTVNGTLTLGKLSLGNNNIVLGTAATVSGVSSSNYIVTTGTGIIRKGFSADGAFTYPAGDSVHYTPLVMTMTASGYSSAYADVRSVTAVHPSNASVFNYLGRYWNISLSGITSPSYNVTGTYASSDIHGFASAIASAVYTGSLPWTTFNTADTVASTVTATGLSNTSAALSGYDAAPAITTWNGSSWTNGAPGATSDVIITSTVVPTPSTFSVHDVTIDPGVSLNTGTNAIVTITGDITNDGNGLSGTGAVIFAKAGTSSLGGDTIKFGGTITVSSGCTLQTNGKLRLSSRATYNGHIGQSAGTISGNVIVERYNIGRRAYRFFAHPFTSAISLSQLTTMIDITGGSVANGYTATSSNNPSAFWFNSVIADTVTVGTNAGWVAFSGSLSTANWNRYQMARIMVRGARGEGLTTTSYTPSTVILSTIGNINQGTQVITMTKGTNSQFVTCGNPYPCGVQMSTVTKGSSISANYSVWDPSLGTAGAYVSNPYAMSYVLPAFAAISTTATDNTDVTLTFHESDKVSTFTTLSKPTAMPSWVELHIADSTNNWDRVLLHLDENASADVDAGDAVKLSNPDMDMYALSGGKTRLSIDVRPYSNDLSIPLGIASMVQGSYVIRTGMYSVPDDRALYLHDKYLGRTVRLRAGAEYWFDITADAASQGEERFVINTDNMGTTNVQEVEISPIRLFPNPAHASVQLSYSDITERAQVTVTNVTGQVVYTTETPAGTGSITIPLQDVPAGIYQVRLQSGDKRYMQKLTKN